MRAPAPAPPRQGPLDRSAGPEGPGLYRDFGRPPAGMRRDLRKAIDAYYAAELAGDREAMAAAEAEADRVLKGSLEGTFSAVMAGLRPPAEEAEGT